MRRLSAGGGIAIVAFLAGWLMLTGPAKAQPSTLPFTVSPTTGAFPDTQTGATSAVTFTITWTSSLPGSFSDFQVASPFVIQTNSCGQISYPNTCKITVDFAPTLVGPATGSLTLAYTAGQEQGTDSVPLTGAGVASATDCHCTKLSFELTDFEKRESGREVAFILKWRMECALGTRSSCAGKIFNEEDLTKELSRRGLHLHRPPDSTTFHREGKSGFILTCGREGQGGCTHDVVNGNERFEILGPAHDRRDLKVTWRIGVDCFDLPEASFHVETLTLKFGDKGNLEPPPKSHLGKLD